ncbi:hypothetical protein TNCV_1744811 [Trichonephila clavipes]|nr:hypothetical protein TNCV_1744811 [Trichonephila clavipes]
MRLPIAFPEIPPKRDKTPGKIKERKLETSLLVVNSLRLREIGKIQPPPSKTQRREAGCNQLRDFALAMCETHQSRFSTPYGGLGQVFSEQNCMQIREQQIQRDPCEAVRLNDKLGEVTFGLPPLPRRC